MPLPVKYRHLEGRLHYVGGPAYHHRRREAGSDVDVCFGGKIAVSRIQL
jgi:5'-nucleotidase